MSKLEDAIAKMKSSNVRITTQRVAVLEYLLNCEFHPSADEIYKAMNTRFPSISRATIYNNLNILCENGLARELTFGNAPSRFDGNTKDHYHIICNNCGKIADLQYPLLKEIEVFVEQIAEFKVSHHRLDIYGKCVTCYD
ncbi:transcriptional repressor [Oceanobacillus sp. 143]|uniref:Transcriptional repressor n=1 Tax=Oceanobacillus zhaokaii TaxID=2052660 RepID=A0A345PCN2_9BACI|nr:transcriptional repressor [Oceanobacillus zhaokaii]AXI07762.1 transcriptional repressor [Oceanobacillus zhaokaii]QGS67905.1 transcriptional repressor [Oceanobacillus sp. 143]